MLAKVKSYYWLSKPGIIYANLLTALAGYMFGSAWNVQVKPFLGVLAGVTLVIAAAAVYNNVLDRKIDKQMKRTKQRSLVTGDIGVRSALLYATGLMLLGFIILGLCTPLLVSIIGVIGFVDYVALYGWTKRHTLYSTLVGSISGSTAIVAGYCTATGRFDVGAWLLFAILILWQIPHFYAIALYRRRDYAAAGLPVMPVMRSVSTAKRRIIAYIIAYIMASILLTTQGYAGISCMVILVALGVAWLIKGLQTYADKDDVAWGKQMFLFSLVVNIGLSLAITFGSVTP